MMLRVKGAYVSFKVIDKSTGEEWIVKPREFVATQQASSIAAKPDMCWQFVQWLKAHYNDQGIDNIAIYADGKANLNGNGYAPLYNPEVNLADVEWESFQNTDWLLPYTN